MQSKTYCRKGKYLNMYIIEKEKGQKIVKSYVLNYITQKAKLKLCFLGFIAVSNNFIIFLILKNNSCRREET